MGKITDTLKEKLGDKLPDTRICKACNGEKLNYFKDGPCRDCKGTGMQSCPDFDQIMADVKGRKGLRSSRPKHEKGDRSYYVWRMARFHGGIDVTMPFFASVLSAPDSYKDMLDEFANAVARILCGTDLAAAYRWGNALGYNMGPVPPGLPMTAQPGGPVVLGTKPAEERPELDAPTE